MPERYIGLEELTYFQIDHTSKCNLLCPQCARAENGRVNSKLPLTELTLADYERAFAGEWVRQLQQVVFCGNYGDAAASDSFLPALQLLRERGARGFSLFTNGSLRSPAWWRELAQNLRGPRDKVVFAIDGLAETNSIYRTGSKWEKIEANARAFIAAGGKARWDYLVFEHNQHQVNDAKEFARSLGFHEFVVKATNRFINNRNYLSGDSAYSIPEPAANENPISPPRGNWAGHDGKKRFDEIIRRHGSWDNYISATPVSCKYKGFGLFLDMEARVWPCCWLGSPIYHVDPEDKQKQQIESLRSRYGHGFNDLRRHSLLEILEHPWFAAELSQSWGNSVHDANPKLRTCGRTCGEKYEFSSGSKENRSSVVFESDPRKGAAV